MTTFTGPLIVRALDSSVTAAVINRDGSAFFTQGVSFGTSAAAITSAALANVVRTTAGNPHGLSPYSGSAGGIAYFRGAFQITVDGTAAYVPFFYSA